MKVRTSFLPIRMVIEQTSPVTLTIKIKNEGEEPSNYSVVLALPSGLGFDRSGLTREKRNRIGTINPGEWKTTIFRIYPKFGLKPGLHNIEVYAKEHPMGRYDKDIDILRINVPLRVISSS